MGDKFEGFLYALAGAVIALLGKWLIDEFTRRREQRLNAVFLAVRVVHELERFIAGCLALLNDPGPGPDNYQDFTPVEPPVFDPHDLKVEWKSIDSSLVYEVLNLSSQQAGAELKLSRRRVHDASADTFEMVDAKCEAYLQLGLHAVALAAQLRRVGSLPAAPPVHEEMLRSWAEEREDRRARQGDLWRALEALHATQTPPPAPS